MSQTFTSSATYLSSTVAAATAVPVSLAIWVNTPGGQSKKFLSLANRGSVNDVFQNGLDTITSGNAVAAFASQSTGHEQVITSAAMTTGQWQHAGTVFSSAVIAAYLNGTNKGSGSGAGAPVPGGINGTIISGRPVDYAFGIAGQAAHAAVWARALSDVEWAYLGAGGNPRAIKGTVSYWKLRSGDSPVPDVIGTNNLTATGPPGAGTSDPNFTTFMTGGPVGNLSYTAGTAITSINLAAAGGYFDDVSSAFTVTLQQATATGTTSTTTSSPGTTLREIPMTSVSGFAAGDYVKVGSNAITRLLAVNTVAVSLLVAVDQTYSASASVTRYSVSPLTVTGLSMSANVFSGTPAAATTQNLCFFRATCNASSALMGDTDVFTITVASGGGGGGGLQMPAGAFCGGFVGG
jgi:hypothetical protein